MDQETITKRDESLKSDFRGERFLGANKYKDLELLLKKIYGVDIVFDMSSYDTDPVYNKSLLHQNDNLVFIPKGFTLKNGEKEGEYHNLTAKELITLLELRTTNGESSLIEPQNLRNFKQDINLLKDQVVTAGEWLIIRENAKVQQRTAQNIEKAFPTIPSKSTDFVTLKQGMVFSLLKPKSKRQAFCFTSNTLGEGKLAIFSHNKENQLVLAKFPVGTPTNVHQLTVRKV
ncbi:MAG: hypothetical protein AAB441_01580 [Patescibacteria group bacterium]